MRKNLRTLLETAASLSLVLSVVSSAQAYDRDPYPVVYRPPSPVTRGSPSRYPESPPVRRGTQSRYPQTPYPGASQSSSATRCPPYTAYNPQIGRCVADPYGRRRMQERPPVVTGNERRDADERSAVNIVNAALRGLDCGQASEALRRLSNQVLQLQAQGAQSLPPSRMGRGPGDEVRVRWREHVQSPEFWKKVWNHMADAYRSCNRSCFDDGISVGQLSATAYCSASIALGGLPGPGYIEQPPLPVCETAIFAGCIQSYGETANSTTGCETYTTDTYQGIFAEYQSQDCHL